MQRENRVEMTDRGSGGKAKTDFPPLPPPLEIAGAISTFPPDGDSPIDPAPTQRREPMSYLLDKQPSRLVMCHPSCRSKLSIITPVAQPSSVFPIDEIQILDRVVKGRPGHAQRAGLSASLARLGGYLARNQDGPPGNTVIWRGLLRLNDIHLGYLAALDCG